MHYFIVIREYILDVSAALSSEFMKTTGDLLQKNKSHAETECHSNVTGMLSVAGTQENNTKSEINTIYFTAN